MTQSARLDAAGFGSPCLGCVLNHGEGMLRSDAPEEIGCCGLTVEMDRKDCLDPLSVRSPEQAFHRRRVQIEGGWVDVGQYRRGSGAEDGAYGGKKAERGGDDGIAGADAGGCQGKPESVGAGGAAEGVGYAELFGGRFFEDGHRLAENELLGVQHATDGFKEFLLQWAVLALQVQHGHRLGGLRRRAAGGQCFLHGLILTVAWDSGYPQAMRRIQTGAKEKMGRAKQELGMARKRARQINNR